MWLKSHRSQRKKQIVSLAAYENGVTHMHLRQCVCVCVSIPRVRVCVCVRVSGWELAFLCFSFFFKATQWDLETSFMQMANARKRFQLMG